MIVRILGERQYEVGESELARLEELDEKLNTAIAANDEHGFADILASLIEDVRSSGTPVGPEVITPSNLTVPHEGATIAEVRELLNSEDLAES